MPGGGVVVYPRDMPKIAQETCVIYTRLSQDRKGDELGVERQEQDCRALAARLGLVVEQIYVDNDISATSGALRPEFEAMLRSRPRAIIVWHQDRLLRLTSDLEKVIALEVPVHMVTAGSLELATPAGRAVARTVAAWSQYETEQKALRQRAANQQAAEYGSWQFSNRPYGYQRVGGRIELIELEAKLIRDGYRRVLRGASYRSVARRWNRIAHRFQISEWLPIKNELWSGPRVQRLLENPRYAGVVVHKGKEVELLEGRSPQWQPIIGGQVWYEFRQLKLNRKRKRSWAVSPKHLLSGMLTCGVCGGQVYTHANYKTTRTGASEVGRHRLPVPGPDGKLIKHTTYVCFGKHCVSIRGAYVDALVEGVVIARLHDERIVQSLRVSDDTKLLEAELADLQRRRDDVTELLADGLLLRSKARESLEDLASKLERTRVKIEALRGSSPLSDLRLSESISGRWNGLPIISKRQIISDLGLQITINRATKGKRGIDPATGKIFTDSAWTMQRVVVSWVSD